MPRALAIALHPVVFHRNEILAALRIHEALDKAHSTSRSRAVCAPLVAMAISSSYDILLQGVMGLRRCTFDELSTQRCAIGLMWTYNQRCPALSFLDHFQRLR